MTTEKSEKIELTLEEIKSQIFEIHLLLAELAKGTVDGIETTSEELETTTKQVGSNIASLITDFRDKIFEKVQKLLEFLDPTSKVKEWAASSKKMLPFK